MRILATLFLALFLSGCALYKTYNNPVDRNDLYVIENSAIVVFAGLNAYKQSCRLNVVPQSCYGVIAKIQVVTRQIPPYLSQLRTFVKNNDQINAITAYNQIQQLIATAKSLAIQNAVPMGGV